jgi:hypothetical protein
MNGIQIFKTEAGMANENNKNIKILIINIIINIFSVPES